MKEKIEQLKRNIVKKKLTRYLGKVIETEDKLICYVKKEKCIIERSHSGYKIYRIDYIEHLQKYKEFIEKYNLNKQIVLILDGITFNKDEIVEIKGNQNCEIQIKNCKFNSKLSILTSGNCTLRNTIIQPRTRTIIHIAAQNLIMNNTEIQAPDLFEGFSVRLIAKNLIELKNSDIVEENYGFTTLEVESNFINIYNSKLKTEYVTLKGKTLNNKNSLITTRGYTLLHLKEFNELNINSPVIKYNDKPLPCKETSVCLKTLNNELDINRKTLLQQLNGIKANLEKYKETKIEQVATNIDNQPIGKILARNKTRMQK